MCTRLIDLPGDLLWLIFRELLRDAYYFCRSYRGVISEYNCTFRARDVFLPLAKLHPKIKHSIIKHCKRVGDSWCFTDPFMNQGDRKYYRAIYPPAFLELGVAKSRNKVNGRGYILSP